MSTNSGKTNYVQEMLNGLGGISQASQAQTGGERAMGMAQTVASIMALMAA